MLCIFITGCAKEDPKPVANIEASGFVEATPGSFDSVDTAVVVSKNDDETITFMNLDTGKNYTLSYSGATTIWDKYGEAMSMAQLSEGEIVDVKFLRGTPQAFANLKHKDNDTLYFIYEEDEL